MWILFSFLSSSSQKESQSRWFTTSSFVDLFKSYRYSRDAEWIFEFASLPVRYTKSLCAVILSLFRSIHIGCCRYACYTIDILIYTSDEFFRFPLEYRNTISRICVSFLWFRFHFFFFLFFFVSSFSSCKKFSRANRKLSRVISFDQVVTQLRSN